MRNFQHKQTYSPFISLFQPRACFVFPSLTVPPSTPISARAVCMPLDFSSAEDVLLAHNVYIIQSSSPQYNPEGFASQMPQMLSKALYPAPSHHSLGCFELSLNL